MKKLILALPVGLLALGFAFLSAPTRADWQADSPVPVPNQTTDYKDNADGSTSPFVAKGYYDIATPAGSYPGSTGSGSANSADVSESNQWKQTYTWVDNGIAPYPFDIGVSGDVSGSCSASPSGFNDYARVESAVSFGFDGNQSGIPSYGDANASGYDLTSGHYGPDVQGHTIAFFADVDATGHSPDFILINVHAIGYGTENFGESTGDCNAYGNVQIPTPHWMLGK